LASLVPIWAFALSAGNQNCEIPSRNITGIVVGPPDQVEGSRTAFDEATGINWIWRLYWPQAVQPATGLGMPGLKVGTFA
jgi:hypothetical protein